MRFSIIGSGRVASHIAPALAKGGLECAGVFSPTHEHASTLAQKIGAETFRSLEELARVEVDFVLISINDDAIPGLAKQFPPDYQKVVLHTSGSTPMDALEPIQHRGVLYPMQTFSKDREIKMDEVPLFIEANSPEVEGVLSRITKALNSRSVTPLKSEERAKLHLASVFACNFVNHLYAQSDRVLHEIGLNFSILQPLVEETLQKALSNPPATVQTGPAARNDQRTMQRHLELLKRQPETQELYKILSESISHF